MLPELRSMLNCVPLIWHEFINDNELINKIELHNIFHINISPLIEDQYYVLELVQGQAFTPHSNFVIITEENFWLAINSLSLKYNNEWDAPSYILLSHIWKQPKTTAIDWKNEGF